MFPSVHRSPRSDESRAAVWVHQQRPHTRRVSKTAWTQQFSGLVSKFLALAPGVRVLRPIQLMPDYTAGEAKQAAKAKEGRTWQTKKAKANLSTPCGNNHDWQQWTEYVKHCRKYRCEREGCGFFKKCWTVCDDIDCKGCHVPAHKRW